MICLNKDSIKDLRLAYHDRAFLCHVWREEEIRSSVNGRVRQAKYNSTILNPIISIDNELHYVDYVSYCKSFSITNLRSEVFLWAEFAYLRTRS